MNIAPFWQPLDENISRWIHSAANPMLDQAMVGITSAGNTLMLITMTAVFAAVLLWRHPQQRVSVIYATAAFTSFLLSEWLKAFFGRARPQLWQQIIPLPGNASFPSGHAMISMTVYGLAAWFLAEHFAQWRKVILWVMGLLILLIGFSRIYLGVHWTSDVLAGFICGFAIVALSAFIHRSGKRTAG
ncbi:MAG: phosphatase PAP2 family protein [Acidobacteria bacterium]|nr:phosphatase PAP2 family protein [Acidobacteriota bacterium]